MEWAPSRRAGGEKGKRKKRKEKGKKDKSKKERERMRNYAEALHVLRPWHRRLLIAKPSTDITTKSTKITTKMNANTTTSNAPTTTRITPRKEAVTSASSWSGETNHPAKTQRHNKLEKEMQQLRKQREEQATEIQITDHRHRDGTTARAKEQGRQEEEGDREA
jgi:hypothetical protein